MLRFIHRIFHYLFSFSFAVIAPNRYARWIGVRMGKNVVIYGLASKMFGSDPWLITLGDNVFITSGVTFITHDGGTLVLRSEVPDLEWTAPITVGNDVYIGFKAILLPGVTVGNRCIIGAGSVVTRPVPDNSVVAGVPARVIKSTDDYLRDVTKKSLKCGHLRGKEKERELKRLFNITHI